MVSQSKGLLTRWVNESFTEKEVESDQFFATLEWWGDKWVVVDFCWWNGW